MKIFNGENMLLGRLASTAAKQALLGEEVRIVNCEKVMISGQKAVIFAREKQRRERKGYPLRSLKLPRLPQIFVRKAIRGMLPWKNARGKEAYKKIFCYTGLPLEFQDKPLITIDQASVKKLPTLKCVSVGQMCLALGGKA